MQSMPVKKKTLYLHALQYLPIFGTFLIMIHYVLILCGIRTIIIDYLAGTSLFAWIFIYASSEMFFCKLHRAFIIYIGIASLDVNLHHWVQFRLLEPRWIMPVIMIAVALALFLIMIFHKSDCNNEQ